MGLLRLGVVKGYVGGAIGAAIGLIITLTIRAAMGLSNAWSTTFDSDWNVMVSVACFTGTIGFMIGVGSMNDWIAWAIGRKGSDGHYHPKEGVPHWHRFFGMDTNHKVVGIQYGVLGIIALGLGGLFAMIFRTELTDPGLQYITEDEYNNLIGLHGLMMILSVLLGIGAMANYLVPLMIGAQDMAFPRMNGFAFWINVPALTILMLSLPLGGFDTGWTAYPPLSVRADLGMQMALTSFFILGFSSILGGMNLLVTIFMMRAPGMTLFRMPIFVWGVLAASLLQLTATQFIGLAYLMVVVERAIDIPFFDPARGGDVTLYQHIFWFYSHPTVYIWVLPGLGIISEILPVYVRKPLFGYAAVALSSMAIAVMGYLVWAHHMFSSALDPTLRIPFMLTTLLIAVPTGIKFFSWLATMWEGKIHFATPMYFVLGAFVIFLLGGLTGPPSALVVTGLHLHDSHFVVAHFHMTAFGGFVFAYVAAIYFWFPKMTGRNYNEFLGKVHFGMMFIGFTMFTLSLFRIGLLGMRRRIVDYEIDFPPLNLILFQVEWNHLATLGGFLVGGSFIVMLANLAFSAAYGIRASHNPWRSRGLEWQIASPPPELNYRALPQIVGNPYDYGLPDAVYAILSPEDQVEPAPEKEPDTLTPSPSALPVEAGD